MSSFKNKIDSGFYPSKKEFEKLNTQNLSRKEICEKLHISISTYKKIRRYYNIEPKKHKVDKTSCKDRGEKIQKAFDLRYGEKGTETRQKFQEQVNKKRKNTCLVKYGVENPSSLTCFIEKRKDSLIEKYGVDNPMKVPAILEKAQNTSLQKYGTKHHISSSQVRKKIIESNIEHYGVPYTSMLPDTTKKRNATNIKKYGSICALGNPEVRKKGFETMNQDGTQAVLSSKQQIHINNLLHGELNYLFGYYHIDSYIQKDHIGIEYSGRGHDLSVRLKKETKEHFLGKEKARRNYFKNHHLPILEFLSNTDKLPNDEQLIVYYNLAKENFEKGIMYLSINLDTGEILCE